MGGLSPRRTETGVKDQVCPCAAIKVRFIGLLFRYTESTENGKEQDSMDYNIVWVRGHVEVYDWAGRFCFSADNEREALEELELTA